MIITILIGNTIANVAMTVLVIRIAENYGGILFGLLSVLTVFIILFGEVLPKTIAATFSEKIAYIVAPMIRLLCQLIKTD